MRPTWQMTPCPSWCDGGHHESDHPEDRVHRSAGTIVPVISRRVTSADPIRHEARAQEYAVGLSRRDGAEGDVWLYVGAGPGEYLEISPAQGAMLLSAVRGELERALGETGDGDVASRRGGRRHPRST